MTHITDGMSEADVEWTTPKELETAAVKLSERISAKDPRIAAIVEAYRRGMPKSGLSADELVQDLADVAMHARYAADAGAKQMALEINW